MHTIKTSAKFMFEVKSFPNESKATAPASTLYRQNGLEIFLRALESVGNG